jgi:hypothetical protein
MALSNHTVVSDGTLTRLQLSFAFATERVVIVTFDGILTSAWTWQDSMTNTILFLNPVPKGVVVKVQRVTRVDKPMNIYQLGAQFNTQSLDQNFLQNLFGMQEALEGYLRPTSDFDMQGHSIRNLGPAVLPTDAVSYGQVAAGMVGTINSQTYSGDAVTTAFPLDALPMSKANTQVYVEGVYQEKDTYTLVDRTIVFSEAPPVGVTNVEVVVYSVASVAYITADSVAVIPTPTLVATTTQAALTELDTNKMKRGEALTTTAPADAGGSGVVSIGNGTSNTVGAPGASAPLPATPRGYLIASVDGNHVHIPYYNR